jgi:hypothetical protein
LLLALMLDGDGNDDVLFWGLVIFGELRYTFV